MASYTATQVGLSGVTRSGATVFREVEYALGGAVLRDLWDNPNDPPAGVTIPTPWNVHLIDHQAVPTDPADELAPLDLDDDAVYLVRVLDGGQTEGPPADLAPNLKAWAAALPRP